MRRSVFTGLLVLVIVGFGSVAARSLRSQLAPETLQRMRAHSVGGTGKPNVVYILADDAGVGDFEPYPNPTKMARLKTPVVSKLASDGMLFTDAYAGYSSTTMYQSTPSFTLMTGYHTGHHPVNNGAGALLNASSTTVAHVMKQAGYHTALIGKWGLDGNPGTPVPPGAGFPTRQGFDYFSGSSNQFICHNYYPSWTWHNETKFMVSANANASVAACGPDHAKCEWSGDLWTDDAVAYIKGQGALQQQQPEGAAPFFLYLSYTTPHAGAVGNNGENDVPIPGVSKGPYANEQWPSVERDFATAITTLDARVGAVLDAIQQAGLDQNTLVFFASDNGAHDEGGHNYLFFNSSGILNGFKRSIHDGGHRSPFIARWSGVIPPGTVTSQQYVFYDLLPTLADLAGVAQSALPPKIDGISILPALTEHKVVQPDFIYHEYNDCLDPVCKHTKGLNCAFGQNIRMGNWSGVCVGPKEPCDGKAPGAFWLYDMSVDEAQQHDVASQHPDIVSTMLGIMHAQYDKNWPN